MNINLLILKLGVYRCGCGRSRVQKFVQKKERKKERKDPAKQ